MLYSFPLHVVEDYKICNEHLVIGIYIVRSVLSTEIESGNCVATLRLGQGLGWIDLEKKTFIRRMLERKR